jgi:hypothetical protein
MSRLVFGESLSPDEQARLHRATLEGVCAVVVYRSPRPAECSLCRYRTICGERRDDREAAKLTRVSAEAKAERECQHRVSACPDFPWCGHVPPEFLKTEDYL